MLRHYYRHRNSLRRAAAARHKVQAAANPAGVAFNPATEGFTDAAYSLWPVKCPDGPSSVTYSCIRTEQRYRGGVKKQWLLCANTSVNLWMRHGKNKQLDEAKLAINSWVFAARCPHPHFAVAFLVADLNEQARYTVDCVKSAVRLPTECVALVAAFVVELRLGVQLHAYETAVTPEDMVCAVGNTRTYAQARQKLYRNLRVYAHRAEDYTPEVEDYPGLSELCFEEFFHIRPSV